MSQYQVAENTILATPGIWLFDIILFEDIEFYEL